MRHNLWQKKENPKNNNKRSNSPGELALGQTLLKRRVKVEELQ